MYSFLDLHAEVERTSKPKPVVTQEFTVSLESLISTRIKEGRFDDVVVRKTPGMGDDSGAGAGSGGAGGGGAGGSGGSGAGGVGELSQEKSRQGLGEVYAEEFLAQRYVLYVLYTVVNPFLNLTP
jgi:hypothetical protein